MRCVYCQSVKYILQINNNNNNSNKNNNNNTWNNKHNVASESYEDSLAKSINCNWEGCFINTITSCAFN